MSLTITQLKDLGFKPHKKSTGFSKRFNTLIYPLNDTDYLYFGYDSIRKEMNNKIIWKSFVDPRTKERISYQVIKLGSTGFNEMKAFLRREHMNANYKPTEEETKYADAEINLYNTFDTSDYFIKLQMHGEDVETPDPVFIEIK